MNPHTMKQTDTNTGLISQNNPRALKNPWVLGWIVLVIIVFSVNIGFISLAFITSPGLVDQNYYANAQDYEENLVKYRTAQSALGWTYQVHFPLQPVIHKKARYQLTVVDKIGQPLTGARISMSAYRPSDAAADFEQHFSEVGAGIYEAYISFPLKGRWEMTLSIEHQQRHFKFTRDARILAHTQAPALVPALAPALAE
ncbi:hypothetical protein MNBD_GAMMA10-820 [hydrothermal vent metagenome]|uniref:Type cbb3 cytochrome oxidase biogenesis protein CcoH n=1 Tax=hydrothermal vent metagenome TaxID=652676 RepID=A0A3B0X307_9ZZZZ